MRRWAVWTVLLAILLFALEHGLPAQARVESTDASGSASKSTGTESPQSGTSLPQRSLLTQSQSEADAKSAGCISCHVSVDEPTMHPTRTVRLGCTDCHGGDANAAIASGTAKGSAPYTQAKLKAHVQPRDPVFARGLANAQRVYTAWLRESYDYVRFANPGDLRVARETCGQIGCHTSEVRNVSTSMMTHGGMLWGAALYNNGSFPLKNARFGESYAPDGEPQAMRTVPPPTPDETRMKGVLPELTPLER